MQAPTSPAKGCERHGDGAIASGYGMIRARPLWRAGFVCLSLLLLPLVAEAQGDEFRISKIARDISGRVTIEVPASSDYYYILLRGDSVEEINQGIAMRTGTNGPLLVSDPSEAGGESGFYRVRRIPSAIPHDTDGDGIHDVYELAHPTILDGLRRGDSWEDPDRDGLSNWAESRLGTNPQLGSAGPHFAAGDFHTVALQSSGALWGWGDNSVSQLGSVAMARELSPVNIAPPHEWAAVSAGRTHTVAIRKDGSLWAWGENDRGQLGIGHTNLQTTPARVGNAADWLIIAASDDHTMAIKRDGTLWGWGRNDWGQLGDGTPTDRHSPVRIGTENNWRALASRLWFTLGLRSDGTLWSWGYNNVSQLGDGTREPRYSPVQIGGDGPWSAIAAGLTHAIAVKGEGTIWAWGDSSGGKLGFSTPAGSPMTPKQVGTDRDWIRVACGGEYSLALKTDGSLWATGQNDRGQLANNTQFDQHGWARIGSDIGWVAISA
ncbi:MAG TPA: hypothetical protein VFG14_05330, partial [Chthoniobacteraceae bacterium]|nr:hypothetical protein [Chthoniobacteraceae bacterium]